ncbi:MAG: PepSY-like domain-containing protein [Bacteroidota bacterium]
MKNTISSILSIILLSAFTLNTTPPVEVINAFTLRFPTATNVKWEKENEHEFEASFLLNGLNYAANYSDKGQWIETESPMTFMQLPKEVQTSFVKSHNSTTPYMVSKIEQANDVVKYEIELKVGAKIQEYFYTASGKETTEN